MTFEEFFIKKKIDLDQLKLSEPGLYEEFRFDYAQMGEKSFDHTKKFWFNKLRKIYHLKPDQKPELKKPKINALASQAVPLSSPAIDEKPVYSPRFKPRLTPLSTETDVPEAQNSSALASQSENPLDISKPAYKPRFKAAAIKKEPEQPDNIEEADSAEVKGNPAPEVKPAYKPRFKAAAIKKEPEKDTPAKEEPTPTQNPDSEVKPAYKPRFKPGMMNKPKPKDEEGN